MRKNQAVSLKDMKKMNKSTILKSIWRKEEVSRTELAESTGLSPATVSALIEELLNERMIIEVGAGASSGGRKPILLRMNPTGGYICAVSILSTSITYTLFNMKLEKNEEFIVRNSEEIIIQSLFENLIDNITMLLTNNGISNERLLGIGISISSEYDAIDKRVLFNTGVSVDRMDLDKALSFQYKKPVFIENEINARAIAEYHLGVAKYKDEFIYIDVSEDIQATIVQNGEVLKNPILQNNNMGHMIIDRNGPKCACGKKGCLQVFASINAIVKRVKVGLIDDRDMVLNNSINGDLQKVDFEIIMGLAKEGNRFIKDIISEVLEALCVGILNLITLFSICNIVISGKIRRIPYLPEVLPVIARKYGLVKKEGISIMIATMPHEVVNIGNGAIVINNYFRNM